MIRQSELAECGLACMAMLMEHYGSFIGLSELRRRFQVSIMGTTASGLLNIANELGLEARALRAELEMLAYFHNPIILHWDFNHFVVLFGVRKGEYLIHDPALGIRRLSESEVSKHFTGVVLEVLPSGSFVQYPPTPRMRMWGLLPPIAQYWVPAVQTLIILVVVELLSLALPLYAQISIDEVLPARDVRLLFILAVIFFGIVILRLGAEVLRARLSTGVSQLLAYSATSKIVHHLAYLPLSWFEQRNTQDVISRVGSVQQMADFITKQPAIILMNTLVAVASVAAMAWYSLTLLLLAFGIFCVLVALSAASSSHLNRRSYGGITLSAREGSSLIEMIRGISVVKSFAAESLRYQKWQDRKVAAVEAQAGVERLKAYLDSTRQAVLGIDQVMFVVVVVLLNLSGSLSVGSALAVMLYRSQFQDAAAKLIEAFVGYKSLEVHIDRVSDVALAEREDTAWDAGHNFTDGESPLVALKEIRLRYGYGQPLILDGVDIDVVPGESIAIVGPSGCGKTTLLKIIAGLLVPTSGEIRLNDRVLNPQGYRSWRSRIGYVAQDDALFEGTLAENIAFFESSPDMARVREVARLAAIHDTIGELPMGYDTLVGDMGSSLSGGQRARLVLARALYRRPLLLLIDEGTAHLDLDTESKVNESLRALGITKIVVAHRPETIRASDRIVELSGGKVVRSCSSKEY